MINKCRVVGCHYPHTHITSGHLCGKCNNFGHGQVECNNSYLVYKLYDTSKYDFIPYLLQCKSPGCLTKQNHISESHICELCYQYHSLNNCPNYKNDNTDHTIECPICRKVNNINFEESKIFGLTEKCKICLTNEVNILLADCKHCCLCLDCSKKIAKKMNHIVANLIEEEIYIENYAIEDAIEKMSNIPYKIYTRIYAGMGSFYYIKRDDIHLQLQSFFMHADNWGQYGPETDKTYELTQFTYGYIEII